jgi:hypothetical protein
VTTLHTVTLADIAPQPWRNSGGLTRELLAWPRPQDWLVRVSVATIDRTGPFSPLPGVQRWFAVLSGAGVRLGLPQGAMRITPADPPLAFDGADAPTCELLDGPTEDLNLMLRGEAAGPRGAQGMPAARPAPSAPSAPGAAMRVARPGSRLDGPRRLRALFAATPAVLAIDGVPRDVSAGTLAWSTDPVAASWSLVDGAHAFWMAVEAT